MSLLGNCLHDADQYEDALSVRETEFSMRRRLGESEGSLLIAQGNLSSTYANMGRLEQAAQMDRDIYSGWLKLGGEEHEQTLVAANNYADSFVRLQRFEEAKSLLPRTIPVARRVLGEGHDITLRLSWNHAQTLYKDPAATPDDLREAVTTLEETERTARRVLGGAHPLTRSFELRLREARAALAARETPRA